MGRHKKLLFIDLIGEGVLNYPQPVRAKWNWPIYESFYYPGAEIAVLTSAHLATACGIAIPKLPLTGTSMQYSVDITSVFSCASNLNLFSTSMPENQSITLEGFHWYMESAGTQGHLWTSVENPQIN